MQPTSESPRYWFPAKRYGWGWGLPLTWQGWIVLGIYFALVVAGIVFMHPRETPGAFVAWMVVLTLVLIAICWTKGEPPRWRWGDKR
ncbi:MAG TPA: hypothetical protein VJ891_12830 [Casimicrobiaceae bacterium]|nr:hypothetical protein [Casimicrobiaceae bacterium]